MLPRASLAPAARARLPDLARDCTTTPHLRVLEVPAALDVLAAVVRLLGAAGAEDLLAGLVVGLAPLLVRERLVRMPCGPRQALA